MQNGIWRFYWLIFLGLSLSFRFLFCFLHQWFDWAYGAMAGTNWMNQWFYELCFKALNPTQTIKSLQILHLPIWIHLKPPFWDERIEVCGVSFWRKRNSSGSIIWWNLHGSGLALKSMALIMSLCGGKGGNIWHNLQRQHEYNMIICGLMFSVIKFVSINIILICLPSN